MTGPDVTGPAMMDSAGLGRTGASAAAPATVDSAGPGRTGMPAAGGAALAARQAELIAALTAGAPVPAGFDAR
ncbi:MAG TPA: hypothetical protein VF755_13855, partial [Catenuloplanes sp.]